jgi:hypothetical protein
MTLIDDARDRGLSLEERLNRIRQLARLHEPGEFEALVDLVRDRDEDRRIRWWGVYGLSLQEKRRAFPAMMELLLDPDAELRHEAVTRLPALGDSRSLFALVNLFGRTDSEKDQLLAGAILRAVGETGDPRAGEWLRERAETAKGTLAVLAKGALLRCPPSREDFLYTFIGREEERRRLVETSAGRGVTISNPSALHDASVREFLGGENGFALYVVLPADPVDPFKGGTRLVIAPRRTEHVAAALGADVLAAGEVAFDVDRVVEIDNHSGGYYPAPGSFGWTQRALEAAGLPFEGNGYSRAWPPEGFFDEGVLSRFPLLAR